jgi:hypothetical protein
MVAVAAVACSYEGAPTSMALMVVVVVVVVVEIDH